MLNCPFGHCHADLRLGYGQLVMFVILVMIMVMVIVIIIIIKIVHPLSKQARVKQKSNLEDVSFCVIIGHVHGQVHHIWPWSCS